LVRTRTTDRGTIVDGPVPPAAPLAFVGMQACDLAALQKLDVVLAHDEVYQARRASLFVAAVACTTPASTCFCVSAGTGPMPGAGADVVMAEVEDATGLSTTLLMAAHSPAGERLLEDLGAVSPAPADLVDRADAAVEAGAASQTRTLDQRAIDTAAADPEHRGWEDIATRCLTCGNCTFVCPTCFCTSVEDANLLDGSGFERSQRWDSCFSLDFSYLHGGPVRSSAASRYRQWYLHKLVTWHDQFGSSGCVGCGRCITWCPTGIDITEAVIP
jgi:ferredoxin